MRKLPASVVMAVVLAALAGCDGDKAGLEAVSCPAPDTAAPPSGLRPLAATALDFDRGSLAHAREVAVGAGHLFIGDANGLPILNLAGGAEAPSLTLVHPIQTIRDFHCSTVAYHAPSATLLCAAADSYFVDAVDVSNPATPTRRSSVAIKPLGTAQPTAVPDVEVSGDTVWMAGLDVGLIRSELSASGALGPVVPTGKGGSAVAQVAARGGLLYLLDRARGLVVLDEATLGERAVVPLDGPPIDLHAEPGGTRLAVAMASEGVALFDVDASGQPSTLGHVQPKCVATAAALSGDLLAIGCLTGVHLYDLRGETPRPAGFVRAEFGILDVAFTPQGLVVVDWFRVAVLATDVGGVPTVPDAPMGMRLAPGASASVPLRNPGAEPLVVGWHLEGGRGIEPPSGTVTLAPFGEALIELDAATLEGSASLENNADLLLYRKGEAPSCGGALASKTRLWHRSETDRPEDGKAAIGDLFPVLQRTKNSSAPQRLPEGGEPTLVMFLTIDCYLQWPQLEDMAYGLANKHDRPKPLVFFLTPFDTDPFDPSGFMRTFAAEALLTVEFADYLGSVPRVAGEQNPVRAFEESFMMRLPGADYPHDYRVGADGRVDFTSRMYRGRWPLGE